MADHAEAYSYEKDFDLDWYVANFCSNIRDDNGEGGRLQFSLDCLHDVFKNGEFSGTLLDIGTGPTVHSVISASRHVTEIHLSDLVYIPPLFYAGEIRGTLLDIGEIRGRLLDIGTEPTVHSVISASRHVTEIHLSDLVYIPPLFYAGDIRGTLLDIGTGPTVHSVISASRHVTEIHLSDLVDRNRDVLQKWRDGEPNVVPSFQYIMELENDGLTLEDRISLTRDKVTIIYPLDLRQSEPLPDSTNKYDVIMASLSLTTITKNKQEFVKVVEKVAAMLKPMGHLLIIGVIKGTFYTVGNAKFGNPNLSREDTMEVLREAGLEIIVWREMTKEGYKGIDKVKYCTDVDDFYFACCRKV